jgi:glycosyltransferase involved in cell wall biosynthesis
MCGFADEVWVLTRSNNQAVIEANPLSRTPNLHFVYYDLPNWALKLKKRFWFRLVYFILWQYGAYRLAKRYHRDKSFDCVYHITFASMQSGSFMGRLGIPFVIGPIAGGERAPFRLRRSMPIAYRAAELLRDVGIMLQRCSPLERAAFAAAKRIFVTTPNSLRLIPRKWRGKSAVHLAIAMNKNANAFQSEKRQPPLSPRFVFAGRLLHWKGVHLAIRAMAQIKETFPEATFTVIGKGPAEKWLQTEAKKAGVTDAVVFAGRLPRPQLLDTLHSYTAFVFPSLHDSGGMVVLEALSQGVPVICLDLGGPGIVVNEYCGFVVPTVHASEGQVVTGIANAMIALGAMPVAEWKQLSAEAIGRANELSWSKLTEHVLENGGHYLDAQSLETQSSNSR